jgi:hypothetical protein
MPVLCAALRRVIGSHGLCLAEALGRDHVGTEAGSGSATAIIMPSRGFSSA